MGVVTDLIQSTITKKRKRMKFAYGLVLGLVAFTQAKAPPPDGYGNGKLENQEYGGGKGKLENKEYGGEQLRIWEGIDYDDDAEKCSEEDKRERNCKTEWCPDMERYCCACYEDKKRKLRIWEGIDYDDDAEKCSEEDKRERNCKTEWCPDMERYCCACVEDKKVAAS